MVKVAVWKDFIRSHRDVFAMRVQFAKASELRQARHSALGARTTSFHQNQLFGTQLFSRPTREPHSLVRWQELLVKASLTRLTRALRVSIRV